LAEPQGEIKRASTGRKARRCRARPDGGWVDAPGKGFRAQRSLAQVTFERIPSASAGTPWGHHRSRPIDSPGRRRDVGAEIVTMENPMSTAAKAEPGFATLAIHAGAAPDPATGARATPIYQTTSYVFNDADHAASLFALEAFGNIYTRIGNPTQGVLEQRVAALEGGTAALAVASGHAAQLLTFHTLLEPGDAFVAGRQLYGGSINQFNHAFKKFDWHVQWADANQPETFEAAITPKTKAIMIESIANPGGLVIDIAAIAAIAKKHGLPLIVDNTMASPYLCRPKEHGADIVLHSLTKFMGGHGNSIGGVIVDCGTFDWLASKRRYPTLQDPNPSYNGLKLAETFGNFGFAIACRVMGLRDLGPAISPFNAFMILTGIETLPLRMEKHVANATAVAQHLAAHPKVAWVNYAGLSSNPNHAVMKRIAPKGAGAVFTFGIKGGYEAGVTFVSACHLLSHLANIGDTRSLVIHPASTTHRQLTDAQRVAAGAGPDVIRLSIGLEDVADIITDLDQALAATA
jgi:O-acetylhomoserine (thiol)-lyase